MKEVHLLNLIEAGFKGYHEYHKSIDNFINQLYLDGSFGLAKKVKKIQDENYKIIKC